MDNNKIWVLPVPSTCIRTLRAIYDEEGNALLEFEYYNKLNNNQIYNGRIKFLNTLAYRQYSEKFVKSIGEAYDTLVECNNSRWIDELRQRNAEWANYWDVRHYQIYFDSYGLFEFIAANTEVEEVREGIIEWGT